MTHVYLSLSSLAIFPTNPLFTEANNLFLQSEDNTWVKPKPIEYKYFHQLKLPYYNYVW